jgi:hypothetical protein
MTTGKAIGYLSLIIPDLDFAPFVDSTGTLSLVDGGATTTVLVPTPGTPIVCVTSTGGLPLVTELGIKTVEPPSVASTVTTVGCSGFGFGFPALVV